MANINSYQAGNVVNMTVQFTTTSNSGIPADPTTIKLRVIDPNDIETDYTYSGGALIKTSVGNYSYPLQVLTAGTYNYRFEGLGAVIAAAESSFQVSSSRFPSPL